MIDPKLLDLATPAQRRVLEAVIEAEKAGRKDTHRAAALALGTTEARVKTTIHKARVRARARGYDPENGLTHTVGEGAAWQGTSTLYRVPEDGTGRLLVWHKTRPEHAAQLEALQSAVDELVETVKPPPVLPRAPKLTDADLLAVYAFGDPHGGMFARAKETRSADYDLVVFERLHAGAVDHLASVAPPASEALLLCVGDLLHCDTQENRTVRAGHALDVDTRFAKVIAAVERTWIRMVWRALERHALARVILAAGNHDPTGSYWLSRVLAAYFRNEPRVTIDDNSGGRFHYHRHGRAILGVTHGDMAKPKILGEVMSRDRDTWANDFRHWYTGHLHTDQRITLPSCTVDVLPTLAPGDAWSAAMGYRSPRSARLDVWHREHGQVSSQWVTPGRVAA